LDNAPVAPKNASATSGFARRRRDPPRPRKTGLLAAASAAVFTLPGDTVVRPMLLLNNLDIGGAEVAVLNLAIGLMALGCKPLVYGWRRGGALEARFRDAGVEIDVPPEPGRGGWRRLAVPRLLAQAVEQHGITVLHAHLSDSVTWAALLQSRVGVPCVVSHHTTDLIDTVGINRPLYGWARRRLLSASSRAIGRNIAVSDAVRDKLIDQAGIPEHQIVVIENGLPQPPADQVASACAERRARDTRRRRL